MVERLVVVLHILYFFSQIYNLIATYSFNLNLLLLLYFKIISLQRINTY